MSPQPSELIDKDILFFDGVCNLCNSAIQFIIRHERDDKLYFAPLQSPLGKKVLHDLSENVDSLVLVENGSIYLRSNAALRVARHLRSPYRWLYYLVTLPRFIRDWAYDLIARNRYSFFGKRSSCMVPTPSLKARFL
ncbi:MAG: DUF393 domain-containing protein [Saprospiraceae bacterium]|nr:DUF393 domain-containing protein [Saprospiraceae bacterium]